MRSKRTGCLFLALGALSACSTGGGAPPETCEYPMGASGELRVGSVMPELAWGETLSADGSSGPFSMHDFYCTDRYDAYTSMIVLVSAGWCSACPAAIARMNGLEEGLRDAGTLVVYVEVETPAFAPATSADAAAFIDEVIAPSEFSGGLRVGNASSMAESVRDMVREFPSIYFVRRRDMHIVADQAESSFVIDWMSLATNPEQTWTPDSPTFEDHCAPGEEESSEPNEDFARAVAVTAGAGEVTGGVCAPASDFYRVDLAGPWRFDLYQSLFTTPDPVTYNVDLRLWSDAMERIGGSNAAANHDWVDYEGPAYVEVYGPRGASGAYRVELSAR